MNRRRFRVEAGETLVESMLTVAILGISFAAILAGIGTAINLSSTHRGQADADVVLVSAADAVKAQPYVACPSVGTGSYDPTQGVTLPAGWAAGDVAVTSVKKWDGSTFVDSCPGTDQQLQLVTITATVPDDRSSETVQVVKRGTS